MKAKIIGIGIIVAVITAIISVITLIGPVDVSTPTQEDQYKMWNTSGPFHVNKFEYFMGENIFIVAERLGSADIGNMVFVMPNSTKKYITIPFDGTQKEGFNQYFKPSLSKARNICSSDQLVGEWTVIFEGTYYEPIRFTIKNETLPTESGIFTRIC